jgi:hypothetical protein
MNTNTNTTNFNTATLASSAVLVSLHIGTWGASKKDKRASNKATAENNAADGTAEVRKKLLPGATALEEIKKLERQIRLWHLSQTLSWNDDGQRLLSMSTYTDYIAKINDDERQFWDLVDNKFLPEYPSLRAEAKHQLGDLFDDADYPDTATVRAKFKFAVAYEPVPEAGHFVVDLQNQAKDELIEQFNRNTSNKWAAAFADVCEEFKDTMVHLVSKVDGADSDKQTRIHASLIPNIRKVIERVRMANAMENNVEVNNAVTGLESLLSNISVEALKTNETARIQVREGVNNILDKFNF